MKDDVFIQRLIEKVLDDANCREQDSAFEGGMSDGGAGRLREQVRFYIYGRDGTIPSEWKIHEHKLDPEYQKYLELKKKFGHF